MATYKGIGFDNTNGRTRTGLASDTVAFDGGLSVAGSAAVTGNLTVTGDIVSRGAVDLVVQDNFIDLNFANSTTTSESGGLTIQMNRNSGFTAGTVTTFVAGAAGVSNPTFTYTDAGSSSAFAAGDIVVMAGAAESGNDGLFVVSAVNQASFPQVVTIKGIGTAAVNAATPWAQNQFTADSGDTATAFKTDIFIQLVADGSSAFTSSAGDTFAKGTFLTSFQSNATESQFTADGGYSTVESTLQSAYNGGNQITTASSTDIDIVLASGNFDVTGGGSVNFGATGTDVGGFAVGTSTFDVNATGAITLDGVGASNLTTTGGALTVSGVGLSLAGGNAEIDVTTTGALDINAAAGTLDLTGGLTAALSGGASSITSTSQNLSIATATSGELDLTSAGLLDINAGADLDIDVTGTVDILASTTFSIDSSNGASNVTATSGALTVSTATSGNLILTSAADVDLTAAAELDIGAGSADIDITGGLTIDSAILSIDSTDNSNLTMTAASVDDKTLNIISANTDSGAGNLFLTAKTTSKVVINGADKLLINTSGINLGGSSSTVNTILDQDNMAADSATALATQQSIKAYVDSQAGLSTVALTVGTGGVAARDVVCIGLSGGDAGKAIKADADAIATGNVIGFAESAVAAGSDVVIRTSGNLTGFSGLTAGNKLYASGTAGAVTATAPSGIGDVVYQVGYARSSSEVVIALQFIMEIG